MIIRLRAARKLWTAFVWLRRGYPAAARLSVWHFWFELTRGRYPTVDDRRIAGWFS